MIGRLYRTPLAVSLAVLTALAPVTPALAQQGQGQAAPPAQPESQPPVRTIQISTENYTNGKRWFPNIIAPYKPTIVPEPVLTNAPLHRANDPGRQTAHQSAGRHRSGFAEQSGHRDPALYSLACGSKHSSHDGWRREPRDTERARQHPGPKFRPIGDLNFQHGPTDDSCE